MFESWRFIDSGACNATFNMAIDEAIAKEVRKGKVPPTLRLYEWDIPSVSIGCFQRISDIDINYCVEKGIPIVRRPTGGRAILHNHEVTYSFSTKTNPGMFSKGLLNSYRQISRAFVLAFSKLGLNPEVKVRRENITRSPLCFHSVSYGEVTIKNKKVIGSAQKRWPDSLLQQGSIPLIIEKDEIVKVFRSESSEIEEKMMGLKEMLIDLNRGAFRDIIKVSFEETFNIKLIPSYPSYVEMSLAEELESKKYLSHQWNFQR